MGQTIADLKRLQLRKRAGKRKGASGKAKDVGRNVRWRDAHLYRCVRDGTRIFVSERDIDVAHKKKTIDESHLWIFKHCDARVSRGEITPLYEAAYCVAGGWYLAQKCHLARVYAKAGRTRAEAMWSLMGDGSPYWVDRYLFRKLKQRSAKKRYEQKLK